MNDFTFWLVMIMLVIICWRNCKRGKSEYLEWLNDTPEGKKTLEKLKKK